MYQIKKHYGSVVLLAICLLPVALWLLGADLDKVFKDTSSSISSLGKASALAGTALYFFMPVLSMRHNIIERMFGGLDKVYRLHKTSGKVSFLLILLHPVLLGGGRLFNRGFTTIWDWSSLVVILGIIALIAITALTIVSIYSHIKHQNWILIHRLFGWAIPLVLLHGLLARSQLVQNKSLLVYYAVLGAIGFCAFIYRSVIASFFLKHHRYTVAEVNHLGETVTELVLKPLGIPMTFTPGQFAFLSFDSPETDREAHPYSISNANNGPYVRFTIKALGDDTSKIKNLTEGTKAFLEGPFGNFSYRHTKNHKQVWIAGGIGITPFLSMARSFREREDYDITLVYGTETLDDAVFLQEFMDITRLIPDSFHTNVVIKKVSGFISFETIQTVVSDPLQFDYFICGPPPMMNALKKQLLEHGVKESQIHIEAFSMK